MLILLIGPKGSGKSHIGRLLQREFGGHFFPVERHWVAYHADCRQAGREPAIAEGIARVHPRIAAALQTHRHVCVETTGASPEILHSLLQLQERGDMLLVKVKAPLELCLQRIRTRDQTDQIPRGEASIREWYALSCAVRLPFDLELENGDLAPADIVEAFRPWFPT